jgi:hypothetical protein
MLAFNTQACMNRQRAHTDPHPAESVWSFLSECPCQQHGYLREHTQLAALAVRTITERDTLDS